MMGICSKCGETIHERHLLEVNTYDNTKFKFCVRCTKEGFSALAGKKDKTVDEVQLLAGLREFLEERKLINKS